jgi:hypothetical protein
MDIQCFYGEFKALDAKKEAAAKEAVKAGKDPAAKGPAKPDAPTAKEPVKDKTFKLDTAYAQKDKDDQDSAKAKPQEDGEESPKTEKEAEAKDE